MSARMGAKPNRYLAPIFKSARPERRRNSPVQILRSLKRPAPTASSVRRRRNHSRSASGPPPWPSPARGDGMEEAPDTGVAFHPKPAGSCVSHFRTPKALHSTRESQTIHFTPKGLHNSSRAGGSITRLDLRPYRVFNQGPSPILAKPPIARSNSRLPCGDLHEFRRLLAKYGVDSDERSVWD
jgi:hypothetical protein